MSEPNEGCEIEARAMIFDVSDEEYPTEWRVIDGAAVCTAFAHPKDDQIEIVPRCPDTFDLFAGVSQ